MLGSPPRFLFDVMLARLCRYARAAGYDAALAQEGESDAALLARSRDEERCFVTLDRRVEQHKAAHGRALVLAHASLDEQAAALSRAAGIDWRYRPFSRCLLDNSVLVPAPPEAAANLPPRVRDAGGELKRCPHCHRLYWAGSHTRRMAARLTRWAVQHSAAMRPTAVVRSHGSLS